MKYVIESLAVIGLIAILAGIGFWTMAYLCLPPESNHERWTSIHEGPPRLIIEHPGCCRLGRCPYHAITVRTDSKDSEKRLDSLRIW